MPEVGQIETDCHVIDELRPAPGTDLPAGHIGAGLNAFLGGRFRLLAVVVQHRACTEEPSELCVISNDQLEIESGLCHGHGVPCQRQPCLARLFLGAPTAVIARRRTLCWIAVFCRDLVYDPSRFIEGKALRNDFLLVAEKDVGRPLGCEMLFHQPERVRRHLLTVVARLSRLEIGVGALLQDQRIGGAASINARNLNPAIRFTSDDLASAGQSAKSGYSPVDRREIVFGRVIEHFHLVRRSSDSGAKDRIERRTAFRSRAGFRVRFVAGAFRQLRQT